MSFGKTDSSSSSRPLTPEEVQGYFTQLDENTGGRLSSFAQQGTPTTQLQTTDYITPGYTATTPEQIKALGGLGATRLARIDRSRSRLREETAADPSLSIFQKVRANQLTDEDLDSRADAINKETEAAIGALMASEAARKTQFDVGQAAGETAHDAEQAQGQYIAERANNALTAEDMKILANIFFGGGGNISTSSGQGLSIGLGRR